MTRAAQRPHSVHDCGPAVKAAIARIQRAARSTAIEPELLENQPGAWMVSWPAIAVAWLIAAALFYGRWTGLIT